VIERLEIDAENLVVKISEQATMINGTSSNLLPGD
jgi:hypothetical protein